MWTPSQTRKRSSVRISPGAIIAGALAALRVVALVTPARANDEAERPTTSFDAVRVVFNARCLRCHGPEEAEAGLDLSNHNSALEGGALGPVIEPGSLEQSLLWDMVDLGEMPPTGPPLTDGQKASIRDWILDGAPAASATETIDHFGPIEPRRLTSNELDALLAERLAENGLETGERISDQRFLRRLAFDLTGRPPTPEALEAFLDDERASTEKRAAQIDDVLASSAFGEAWGVYWSDTIRHRVPPPELTFLIYNEFEAWLAEQLNANRPWDGIVRDLLTAKGKVADDPSTTFVAFHQANPTKLGAETARIFLGLQLQCAECHDHKFDHWKREQFHGLAAFFGRTQAKLAQKRAGPTVVKSRDKGEYKTPNLEDPTKPGEPTAPTFLDGEGLPLGAGDEQRRSLLAEAVTDPDNPWFARAYVNRIWARLIGRGFYDPVDDMAAYQPHQWPEVHDALAAHFVATGYDIKDLFRLIVSTEFYQRRLPDIRNGRRLAEGTARPRRLSAEEVFLALEQALEIPIITPPEVKPTKAIRFPPPPKSTKDLITERFDFDPSVCPDQISRTMGQAMMIMNNEQIQARVDADPDSGTPLARLLQQESDDEAVIRALWKRTLAREPSEREIQIGLEHVEAVGDRGAAFEDLLWSLINSAEFTTRR